MSQVASIGLGAPVETRSFGLRRNVAMNIGGKGFSILTSLFSAPFIIYYVGLRAFGFWAIISAFSQYAGLLDFGVGTALTRHVAELYALRDHDGIARKGAASLYISIVYSIAVLAIAVTFCLVVPSSMSVRWPHGWELAVLGVGVTLAGSSVASIFQAFPGGLARWDLQNLPLIVFQVVFLIAIVILLLAGAGLAGLGAATAIASLSMVVSAWLASRRVWRQSWAPKVLEREEFGPLFRYGMNLQLANLVLVINVQSDKPVLLAFGGSLRFIAFYELASRVAFQLRSLPVMALAPLTAMAAKVSAGQPVAVLRAFYERSLNQVVSMGVAPLFAFFGASWPFVLTWLGTDYTTTAEITVILGTGYALNLVTGAGSALAAGCGRPELDRNYAVIGLAINLVLTILLGLAVGPWGVIAATAIGLPVSSLWMLRSMDRWLGTSTFSLSGPLRRPAPSVVVGLVTGAATVAAMSFLPTDSRWLCLAYGAVSLLLFVIAWGFVTTEARAAVPMLRTRLATLRPRRS